MIICVWMKIYCGKWPRTISTLLGILLTLLVACTATTEQVSIDVSERLLSFPPAYYSNVIQINGETLAFSINSDLTPEKRVSFAFEGNTSTTPFNPEPDPKCVNYSYFQVVSVLPDGRLGLLKECYDNSAATAFLSINRSIYAYDWNTGELERLVDGKLTQGFRPKYYTWNPDLTKGVQETTAGYSGTIYWIDANGMHPMDIEIESRGLRWNLKDHLEDKERTGMAVAPSWSPDGKIIAFFATTYGIREKPTARFNVSYDLFFMDPHSLNPRVELSYIADAGKIVWSPDNKYLLFRGCIGKPLRCGLWRYRIANQILSLINEGEFEDYMWISNNKIVAVKNIDLHFKDNQIWEYTITE